MPEAITSLAQLVDVSRERGLPRPSREDTGATSVTPVANLQAMAEAAERSTPFDVPDMPVAESKFDKHGEIVS